MRIGPHVPEYYGIEVWRSRPLPESLAGHPKYPVSKGAHKVGKKGKMRKKQTNAKKLIASLV